MFDSFIKSVPEVAVTIPVPDVPDTFAVNIVPFAFNVEPAVVKSLLPISVIIYSVPLTILVAFTSAYCNASISARPITVLFAYLMFAKFNVLFAVTDIVKLPAPFVTE